MKQNKNLFLTEFPHEKHFSINLIDITTEIIRFLSVECNRFRYIKIDLLCVYLDLAGDDLRTGDGLRAGDEERWISE